MLQCDEHNHTSQCVKHNLMSECDEHLIQENPYQTLESDQIQLVGPEI